MRREQGFILYGSSWGVGIKLLKIVSKNDIVFHRLHPEKETDKGAVKSVRRFLVEAGFGLNEEEK